MFLDKGEEFWFWSEPLGEAAEMVELSVKAALSVACAIQERKRRKCIEELDEHASRRDAIVE